MARSIRSSPIAFPAAVARFLSVAPLDVKRMIQMDKLPAIELPMAKRKVTRIHLRDLYTWLLSRSKNPPPVSPITKPSSRISTAP